MLNYNSFRIINIFAIYLFHRAPKTSIDLIWRTDERNVRMCDYAKEHLEGKKMEGNVEEIRITLRNINSL